MTKVYVIGSLRNPAIPSISDALRARGLDVFDDWFAAGPIADDSWQAYEKLRGRTYPEALDGYAANHVYNFDFHHLQLADMGVLVTPAGKSAHLELGYLLGAGKPGFILMHEEPERWDVMYKFASGVYYDLESLVERVSEEARQQADNRQARNLQ